MSWLFNCCAGNSNEYQEIIVRRHDVLHRYAVVNMPIVPYHKLKYINEPCPICLEDMNPEKECIFVLKNCGHCFHKDCICLWVMKEKNDCPVCRKFIYS